MKLILRTLRRQTLLLLCLSLLLTSVGRANGGKTLLIFGDSLSAAYGLEIDQGWVKLLEQRLNDSAAPWQVTNLSISGETTSGGLTRLPKALNDYQPQLVLLELGANDGLQGTPLKSFEGNMRQMLTLLKERNIPVLLFEMHIPANYGPAYTKGFNGVYHKMAQEFNVEIVPFFLNGVAGNPKLNLPDGIHPIAEAQPTLLENVWPTLVPYLQSEKAKTEP